MEQWVKRPLSEEGGRKYEEIFGKKCVKCYKKIEECDCIDDKKK